MKALFATVIIACSLFTGSAMAQEADREITQVKDCLLYTSDAADE